MNFYIDETGIGDDAYHLRYCFLLNWEAGNGKMNKILNLVNILLLIKFCFGFFCNRQGSLFDDMFSTNELIVTSKKIF